jgi:ribose 5-phosphate isomerase A
MDDLKSKAARRALDFVQDRMTLGLGSGTTSSLFVDLLGKKLQEGTLHDLRGVATSEATARRAREWGIPIISLSQTNPGGEPRLDLAIDGADEVDPNLDLIKGLGRALLREKVVEIHADRLVIMVVESKLVPRLGTRCPLPVEIIQFEVETHLHWLGSLGCRTELWREEDGSPVITDNGNYLALCWFDGGIDDVPSLATRLAGRPGIVEHGLFLNMASQVIVASEAGVRIMER